MEPCETMEMKSFCFTVFNNVLFVFNDLKKLQFEFFFNLRLWPPLLRSERDEILTILLRAEKGSNNSFLTIFNAITCSGGLGCSCFIARHILTTIDIRRAGKKYALHLTTIVQFMHNFIKIRFQSRKGLQTRD